MASLLAKTKASMEDKGLDGKEKEDPACAVSPHGDSSCEELRAQLAALESAKRRLKKQKNSARSLLVLVNKSESSDEGDEDAVGDRQSILDTLTSVCGELNQNKLQRKELKKVLEAMEEHGVSSALPDSGMGMEFSPVNAGRLFPGEIESPQSGFQSALRERRPPGSETALSGNAENGLLFSPAVPGESGGGKFMHNKQRADHSKNATHVPLNSPKTDSTRDTRAENTLADNRIGNIELVDSADSSVQSQHEGNPTEYGAAASSPAQNMSRTTATYSGGDGEQLTQQKLMDANTQLHGGGGTRRTSVELAALTHTDLFGCTERVLLGSDNPGAVQSAHSALEKNMAMAIVQEGSNIATADAKWEDWKDKSLEAAAKTVGLSERHAFVPQVPEGGYIRKCQALVWLVFRMSVFHHRVSCEMRASVFRRWLELVVVPVRQDQANDEEEEEKETPSKGGSDSASTDGSNSDLASDAFLSDSGEYDRLTTFLATIDGGGTSGSGGNDRSKTILATATAVFRKIGEVARKRRLSNAVRCVRPCQEIVSGRHQGNTPSSVTHDTVVSRI